MTDEEAIKLISMIDVCDNELHVHTHWGSFDDDMKEALKFAIKGLKSLEAWKNVKEDIKERIDIGSSLEAFGLVIAECLIDKHLKEVENNG